jgi:mannose-6-phosphate isomerase
VRPGTLHSYLSGSGVEVMSSSDNVVRGGLTPKHVDAGELLRLTRRAPLDPEVVRPVERAPGVVVYELPEDGVDEFEVRVLSPHEAGGPIPRPHAATARVLLCVAGTARIAIGDRAADRQDLELRAGDAAWVSAGAATHSLRLGEADPVATVYEVTMR